MESLTIHYGRVQVFDHALPVALYNDLMKAVSQLGWRFGWNTPSNPNTRYWHHEVGFGEKANTADVTERIRQHPLPVFAQYVDWLRSTLVPADTQILRCYLNAHTFGTDGWPHTDTDRGEELTAVLYLAGFWKPEWCGETVVFNERGDIAAAVLPAPKKRDTHLFLAPRPRFRYPLPHDTPARRPCFIGPKTKGHPLISA